MAQFTSETHILSLARQLVARLERLSADSYYAHQASGIRGALLRELARAEAIPDSSVEDFPPSERIEPLIQLGFEILYKAALDL